MDLPTRQRGWEHAPEQGHTRRGPGLEFSNWELNAFSHETVGLGRGEWETATPCSLILGCGGEDFADTDNVVAEVAEKFQERFGGRVWQSHTPRPPALRDHSFSVGPR